MPQHPGSGSDDRRRGDDRPGDDRPGDGESASLADESADGGADPMLLRRGRDSVQLGWRPEAGIVVSGLEPVEIDLLTRLDRTFASRLERPRADARAARRGLDALTSRATQAGVRHPRAEALVSLLREQTPRRDPALPSVPEGCAVLVTADGGFPWHVARLLRAAGVTRVELGVDAAAALEQRLLDDGPPAGRAGSGDRQAGDATPLPDLVVLVGHLVVPPASGEPWLRRGIPVLPVVVDADRVVIGPVVDGSRTSLGPCLHCLDLVRTDLDDAWPALAAQVAGSSGSAVALPDGVPHAVLAPLVAAALAMVVTGHLAGRSLPAGVSVEASLPWPRLDHRRWPRHPDCGRHRHTGRGGDIAEGVGETCAQSRETMTG